MATIPSDPFTTQPPVQPQPWDPRCPGCLSGFGPPKDPTEEVAYPIDKATAVR